MTVPLAWAAARGEADHEVPERLCNPATGAAATAQSAMAALHHMLPAEGSRDERGLAALLSVGGGCGLVRPGDDFHEEGQRWLLQWACHRDGTVAGLEQAHLAAVQELAAEAPPEAPAPQRARREAPAPLPEPSTSALALDPASMLRLRERDRPALEDPASDDSANETVPPLEESEDEDDDEDSRDGHSELDELEPEEPAEDPPPSPPAPPLPRAADLREAFAALDAVNLA